MGKVQQTDVPEGSLLAEFGVDSDYRDCFVVKVPGTVTLAAFIERFYCSMAFRPERIVLGLIGGRSSSADAKAVARGESERFGVWKVVERQDRQALLESKGTGIASWFAVEPLERGTKLLFGSWVGNLEQSGWRSMLQPHLWYSKVLLGGV